VRGEIVLRLVVVIAVSDDGLAGGAERVHGGGDFLQLGDAAAAHVAEVEVQRADARVVPGRVDRVDDVAQQGLAPGAPHALGQRTF
jgi:hypothetical protein